IDSEPNVFKASFNGHYLEFIVDFSSSSVKILNKKNYLVTSTRLTNGKPAWTITSPDGVKYRFEELNETINGGSVTVNSFNGGGLTTSGDQSSRVVSRIWHLSRINTPKNQEINYLYQQTTVTDLPTFSQTIRYTTPQPTVYTSSNPLTYGDGSGLDQYINSSVLSETTSQT
ncbi:MAG: hypothetical protein ACKO96_03320, partial [Flammeovirgaceae bacterium]